MVVEFVVTFKHIGNAGLERGVGVQPGHLVLVLVGHDFEQVSRHGLGQRQAGLALGLVHAPHPLHHGLITRGVGGVLVIGEKGHAAADQLVERAAFDQRHHLTRVKQSLKRLRVMGRAPAPLKRRFVVVHCHGIELDGAQQGGLRQGNPALLPRKTQHHGVGVNAVAQQRGGSQVGAEGPQCRGTHRLSDLTNAGLRGVLPVAIFDKSRRGCGMGVERNPGPALAHAQHGFLGHRDDRVTTDHQISRRQADTGGANVALAGTDQHMAPGGATLLRQATRVLGHDAAPVQVRGHTQKLTDSNHPGAADASHHNTPYRLSHATQHRQHRLGQRTQRKR